MSQIFGQSSSSGVLPVDVPTTFRTTAGDAVAALNILTMTNGANIIFSGAGSALTAALSATPTVTTMYATTFDTNVLTAGVTLAATSLVADGTDPDININITAKGAGQVIIDDLQLGTPLTVPYGGTGQATHTIHGVLIGNAAGAINSVADVVNAGYVLMANAAADPSFQALPAAGITSVSGTADQITASTALGAVTLSTPAAFIAPGTIAATTTNTAGTDFISTAGNLKLPTTTSTVGQIRINNNVVFHTYGGEPNNDALRNLWVGKDAGNFTCSTAVNYGGNIGIGTLALRSLTGGQENFALGYKAFNALQGNADNGYRNIAIGNYAGYQLVANGSTVDQGSYNTFIGYGAGGYLNANEYSNIFINYQGVAGQNNRLQLGQTTGSGAGYGKIDTAYICGIYGRTPAGTQNICLVDSNNQLGSVATLPPSLGGAMTWTEVTGTSQAAAVNNGYITNNVALVTVTLPSTAAVGQRVAITGKGAGLWTLAQNAGQTVHFGSFDTTTGVTGSVTASVKYDCVEVQCITANTDWVVIRSVGALVIA